MVWLPKTWTIERVVVFLPPLIWVKSETVGFASRRKIPLHLVKVWSSSPWVWNQRSSLLWPEVLWVFMGCTLAYEIIALNVGGIRLLFAWFLGDEILLYVFICRDNHTRARNLQVAWLKWMLEGNFSLNATIRMVESGMFHYVEIGNSSKFHTPGDSKWPFWIG